MRRLVAPILTAIALPVSAVAADLRPVSFNRDIRPIMADTCFLCHGPDASSREAGMRLDLREEALKPTRNDVIPIVPGRPEESEIIFRITDDLEPMPPEEAHKRLTSEQKELIRRWVAEGAVYEVHWAYAPLVRPPLPDSGVGGSSHPIDAFVRARLAAEEIEPSPEADKSRLLRRLSLDLTGLPPTPAELGAFLADPDPGAYERQVERLLASPHHGERMAVWWLDIARFADTVGFHGDQNQRIFPYRDYVINAFNANKPFDQFTIEQLAGDLLPGATEEHRIATGYNRLNMMTREGGAQPAEYIAKYGAERVRSVSAAWLGSTFGCAECHDHKFDPIKASDFYELQAFFADLKQWGVYSDYDYTPNPDLAGFNNDYPFPPEIEVRSPYLAARQRQLEAELADHRAASRARRENVEVALAFEAWIDQARAFLAREPSGWSQPGLVAVLQKKAVPDGEPVPSAPDGIVCLSQELRSGESLRLTLSASRDPIAAVRIDFTEAPRADPDGRKDNSRNRVTLAAVVRSAGGTERKVGFVFADAAAKDPHFLGGAEAIGIVRGWRIPRGAADAVRSGIWLPAQPLRLAEGEVLELKLSGEAVPPFRVFTSPFGSADALSSASAAVREAIMIPRERRLESQDELLADAWLLSTAWDPAAFDRHHDLAEKIRETRDGRAWTMVSQAAEPRPVRVLARGDWQDESGPLVLPATPSFLPGRRESTAEKRLTRLDFARWLVSAENPITARTVVNRLWAMFFGTGLSATLDDLGAQGEVPSHPELLEWLACEFREQSWDLRHMVRLLVTSATYRQGSNLRPELLERDPGNRLLAAQNPRRLEAEFVRDNALAIAGNLNLRALGGPSVKPYQPAGYYAALQFPDRTYVASDDDEQWRRGVYMHWQRTFLHPMLANFDAPARDECAAQRVPSNTPQQALTLLNDPTFLEAARLFAARLQREADGDEGRIRRAFLIALSRDPRPAEQASLLGFLREVRRHYGANVAEAGQLLGIGIAPRPGGDPVELAAWTSLARVLLNSHEVITRY